MPNKNGNKTDALNRRNPRLSPGQDNSKPDIAHPLGTPGTTRHLTDKKKDRSYEQLAQQKRECRNDSVEVRGSAIFYDSNEVLPVQAGTSDREKNKKLKNVKAVQGVCVDSEEEDITSFAPRQTSTESESSGDECYQQTNYPAKRDPINMDELVNSMALAFQTPVVQESICKLLEPHFNKLIVSLEDYKAKTDDRIRILESEVEKIGPLEEKVNSLQLLLEDQAQEPLNTNLILTGLEDDDKLKDQCITVAAEQLEIDKLDILDIKKLPPTRKRDAPPKYKIRFGDLISRTSFYKARTKKTCKIWMNEDLCLAKSKLAYQARLAVTKKKAFRTWTYMGKVFIIINENDQPSWIKRFEQLPKIDTTGDNDTTSH